MFPGTSLHAASSYRGVLVGGRALWDDGAALGALGVWDAGGQYGTGCADLGSAPTEAGREATLAALAQAGRSGEAPDIVWLTPVSGHEEAILAGIRQVVGPDVPIVGGTAADDTMGGHWSVFCRQKASHNGVVVSVLFPSEPVLGVYEDAYVPRGASGRVTASEGRRILQIDGRPALDVYSEWTGRTVEFEDGAPWTALNYSGLEPLGTELCQIDDVPFYLISHPGFAWPDGSLEAFRQLEVGDEVQLMESTPELLRERVLSVGARVRAEVPGERLAGALFVCCAAVANELATEMSVLAQDVERSLGGAPVLTLFSFGEQGEPLPGYGRHGNLMIGCIGFAGCRARPGGKS